MDSIVQGIFPSITPKRNLIEPVSSVKGDECIRDLTPQGQGSLCPGVLGELGSVCHTRSQQLAAAADLLRCLRTLWSASNRDAIQTSLRKNISELDRVVKPSGSSTISSLPLPFSPLSLLVSPVSSSYYRHSL